MFQKGSRYLADWRDRKGVRRRKSFDNPEAAQAYEDAQKAAAHPKTPRVGRPSPRHSRRSSRATLTAKTEPPRASSLQQQDRRGQQN